MERLHNGAGPEISPEPDLPERRRHNAFIARVWILTRAAWARKLAPWLAAFGGHPPVRRKRRYSADSFKGKCMSASGSKWQSVVNGLIVVVAILSLVTVFSQWNKMGKKFKVSDKESVNYSGEATEEQAKALGEALKSFGFFDGQSEKDVLLKRGPEGTVVSFVMQEGKWDDTSVVKAYETTIANELAPAVGGVPFTIELLNDQLAIKKSLSITAVEQIYAFSPREKVRYASPVTEEDARKFGASLKDYEYFTGASEKDVLLHKGPEGMVAGFIVQPGKWDDAAILDEFRNKFATHLAPALGGVPFTIDLLDGQLNSHKQLKITRLELVLQHSERERVLYYAPVTKEQAVALGKALQSAGYFDATEPADVQLEKQGDKLLVSFMVTEGKWDDEGVVKAFSAIGKKVASEMAGESIVVQLVNRSQEPKKTVPLE